MIRQFVIIGCAVIPAICVAFVLPATAAEKATPLAEPWLAKELEKFQDLKFGFMMHFGAYSQWGCIESWPLVEEDKWARPDDLKPWIERGKDLARFQRDYFALPKTFNPTKFDPASWATAAKNCGMKYVVYTTKHHDGFCMFDTKLTDYKVTSPDCPFHAHPQADTVRAVFDAFRKEGFVIGVYFSKADWHNADYWDPTRHAHTRNPNYDTTAEAKKWRRFVDFVYGQIEELMSNYGPVSLLFLDAGQVRPPQQDIDMERLAAMARRHQPGLIIADRTVGGRYENYFTPEQEVPDKPLSHAWETCMTMGDSWSFKPNDKYKSTHRLIQLLVEIVAKGGNFLLNVGPQPDGQLPAEALTRMREIGAWMKVNGEAIYGTRPIAPYKDGNVSFTRKGNTVYAIYVTKSDSEGMPAQIAWSTLRPAVGSAVRLLGVSAPVKWRTDTAGKTVVELPAAVQKNPPCRHAFAVKFTVAVMLPGLSAAAQAPIVFKVSEGVRPNAVVSLYGEYLTGPPSVRFVKADGSVAATQTAVQTDRGGHFCRVLFPAISPGAYRLAVRNETEWSTQAVYVNRADPRWISEERAYSGLRLKLIGRNLDAWEYGGTRNTQVRLKPTEGGAAVVIAPDGVNPYCVDFTVPAGLAAGRYYVEVSANSAAHGRDWVRLDNHSEFPDIVCDTVVQVERPPTNPTALALEVAWANDFDWNRVADARREFQAKGDGSTDDTRAIQNALDRVGQNGGGVVFLPNGVYKVSKLVLGSRCILQGESREQTVVMVSKTGDDGAIVPRGTAQGISTMTLKYQPSVPARSQGMLLAGTANKLFIYNTKFDLLRKPDVSLQQSPYYFSGSGPMLVADCQFFLSSRNLWDHAVRNRVTFRDNRIDMHDGLGFCMSSEKLLLLRNELTFHAAAYAGQMNGFFLNEGWVGWNIYNAYIAGNNAHDLNGAGDCQPFAADSAWSCFAGAVTGGSANTADVRVDVSGDFKGLDRHEMELLVVQGRGLGQIRRMSAHRILGGSPAVVRCTVSPPWDVPPDTTSVITAGSWHVNNVFYRNTARGSKSPYNMYYGGCYDCVDAEATSDNTEGWNNWGRIGEMPQGAWHCPVYFDQLKRSSFTGISPTYSTMGITLRVENETKNYRGIGDYGTEIRDNTIDRAACSNKNQRLAGNAAIATFNQSWMKVTAETPLIFATLCEANRIKNSSVGFDLNGSFSFAIRGTRYENCPQAVNDRGRDTAQLPGAPDALKPAVLPIALGLPCAGADQAAAMTWLDAEIGQPPAAGGHTIAGGKLTVSGAGEIARDQSHYTYQIVPGGDVEVIGRIVSFDGAPQGRAGIMLRTDSGPTASMAQVSWGFQEGKAGRHGIGWTARSGASREKASGGVATNLQAPLWLRFARIDGYFAVYKSPDGKIWSMIGNTSGGRFASEGPVQAGFFAAGGDARKTATATFDHVTIGKPKLPYRSSWIGNTFGGNVPDGHVSNCVGALWTAADGTCYTNSYWDEGAESSKIYKNGKVVTSFRKENECFGDDFCGEGTITGDGARMYLAARRNLYRTDMLGHGSATHPIYFATDLWDKEKNINVTSGLAVVEGKLYAGNARDNKVMVARTDLPVYYTAGNSSVNATTRQIDTRGVAHAAAEVVYQSQRECDYLPYVISGLDPKTVYTVRCHFAEYTEEKPGRRLVNIGVSGAEGVRGYDVVAAAGGRFRAAVKDVPRAKPDALGKLTVVFDRGQGGDGHIVVCGFEVLAPDGAQAFAVNCGGGAAGGFKPEVSELTDLAFRVTRPGPMVTDRRGDLWIIQEANDFPLRPATMSAKYPGGVKCYHTSGAFTGREITDVVNPTAVAYDAVNDRLLVAENGPDQNIRIYGNLASRPSYSGSFGAKGGLYAGEHPGRLFDPAAGGWARFYGLAGVGIDAEGNFYVASSLQGTDLRKFTPDGKLVWMLNGLFFCNTADVDPDSDGRDVYSPFVHLGMDYTKTAPGSEWTYAGYLWNPQKYGLPPRAGNSQAIVRRLGPRRALTFFTSGQGVVEYVGIFRLDGETAVPCGQIQEKSVWIDKNGDGKETPDEVTACPSPGGLSSFAVDRNGDVWLALLGGTPVLRHYRLKGLDGRGVPQYGTGKDDYEDTPYPGIGRPVSPWGQHAKVSYDCQGDVMYLLGPAKDRKSDKEDPISYLARYDDWSKGNRTARWLITLPNPATDPNFMYEVDRPWGCAFQWMGFDVAGDKIFLAELWGPIHVYDANSGRLDTILSAGPEVSGCNAWEDANLGVRAYRRSNGEYLIFAENSGYFGKNNLFRWKP